MEGWRSGDSVLGGSKYWHASAPELDELAGVVIGTREQVLAAIAVQDGWRRHHRHNNSCHQLQNEHLAVEVTAVRAAAAAEISSSMPNTTRTLRAPPSDALLYSLSPCPLPSMVINLDTGCAVTIGELLHLYDNTSPAEQADTISYASKWQHPHGKLLTKTGSATSSTSPTFASVMQATAPATSSVDAVPRSSQPVVNGALSHSKRPSNADGAADAVGFTLNGDGVLGTTTAVGLHRRRGHVHARANEPLMCGPLLKRGKTLHKWKLRWYSLSIDGEFACFRRRIDPDVAKPPMFAVNLAQLRVTMLPPERLYAEAAASGVYGFRLEDPRASRDLFAESREAFQLWINAFALLGACAGSGLGATSAWGAGISATSPNDFEQASPSARRAFASARHFGQPAALLLSPSDRQRPSALVPSANGAGGGGGGGSKLGARLADGDGSAERGYVLDLCGFRLSGAEACAYCEWCAHRSHEVKRNAKQHERWIGLLREAAADGDGGESGGGVAVRQRRAHELAVGGVPSMLRLRVWSALSGTNELMASFPTHYGEMVLLGHGLHANDRQEVEIDLGRTFPDHPLFAGDGILPDALPQPCPPQAPAAPPTAALEGVDAELGRPVTPPPRSYESSYKSSHEGSSMASTRGPPHELGEDGMSLPSTPNTAATSPPYTPCTPSASADSAEESADAAPTSAAAPAPAAMAEAAERGVPAAVRRSAEPCPSLSAEREPPGRTALRNVLLAYVAHNRGLGYCQALNYVGGMLLLLTEMQEAPAFYLLLHLSESCIVDFYSKHMNGIRLLQRIFEDYFRAVLPQLAAHLDEAGLPLSIATTKWFMCLFLNTLPAETLLRVWDVLLVDGPAILVRVGAALLQMAQPELLATKDFIELSQRLQSLGRGCWSADALLAVAYRQLPSPPAARLALAALERMHHVALEVGVSRAEGVQEVRLREGLCGQHAATCAATAAAATTVATAAAATEPSPSPLLAARSGKPQ